MGALIFLDTNVVVDLLGRRRPRVRRCYVEARDNNVSLALSTVVLFELRFGAANSARIEQNGRALDALLADGFAIAPFDADDAAEAGAIRALLRRGGKEIGPHDILIAAQARRRGATLATHNVEEFERVPGLIVIDWAA